MATELSSTNSPCIYQLLAEGYIKLPQRHSIVGLATSVVTKEQEQYDYNGLTSKVQMFCRRIYLVPFQAIAAFVAHIVERYTDTA